MKSMSTERVYYPAADIIRIIAGVGVILIHVTDPFIVYPPYFGIGGTSWWILNFINAFFRASVPLFIMLSGYLILDITKELNFKEFYTRRLAKIGIPVLFWVAFYFIWLQILGTSQSVSVIIHSILTVNLAYLYFLVIILELYYIMPLIYVFMKNTNFKSRRILLLSSLFFTLTLGFVNALYPSQKISLSENIVTIFLPYVYYFLVGFFLKKVKISLIHVISLFILYLYLIIFIAIASGGVIASYFRQYNSVTIVVAAQISFIILLQLNRIKNLSQSKKIRDTIKYVATLIFGAYLVHMMIIEGLNKFTEWIPGLIGSPLWVLVILKTLAVIVLSFVVVAVGKKIPYVKYLFG